MKAVLYHKYKVKPVLENVDDPTPDNDSIVIKVEASGVCRSDWYGF